MELFSFPLGKHQSGVAAPLTFYEMTKLFPEVLLPFYIHGYQEWVRVPVPSHPTQHLLWSVSPVLAIQIDVWGTRLGFYSAFPE